MPSKICPIDNHKCGFYSCIYKGCIVQRKAEKEKNNVSATNKANG
jgi:hypothetical protein